MSDSLKHTSNHKNANHIYCQFVSKEYKLLQHVFKIIVIINIKAKIQKATTPESNAIKADYHHQNSSDVIITRL